MSRQNKEIEIFNAAIKCIGRHGVERTNAQAIANELGVAQSGIFYYFPKQEDLFDSLVGYIAEVNHETVTKLLENRETTDNFERLLVHMEGNLLWAKKHSDQVAVLLLNIAKTGHSRMMKSLMNRIFQVGEDRIYGYLVAGVAEKEFTIKGDIRSMAAFIHKSLIGMTVGYYYSKGKDRPVDYFLKLMEEQLRHLIEK